MRTDDDMDTVRALISRWLEENPARTMKGVSTALGKNETYLQQFIRYGKPAKLDEQTRSKLAEMMGVDEALLGKPEASSSKSLSTNSSVIRVPVHDVRVSAGGGAFIDAETELGMWPFPRDYVFHNLSIASSQQLAIVEVIGDSMEPTLRSGDKILVDLSDTNPATPGVFVMYDGGGTVVKRIERLPATDPAKLRLVSDNPLHGKYEVLASDIRIVGRVVWYGRRL